jgi:hypothetical protein
VGETLRPLAGFWREVARRAFPEPPRAVHLRHLYRGEWSDAAPYACAGEGPLLSVILPTLARQESPEPAAGCLRKLAESMERLRLSARGPRLMLVVAAQDRPGNAFREDVLAALEDLWTKLPVAADVPFAGVSVSLPSKVLAINSTIPLLDRNGVSAVAWFDDDIEIQPGCLTALWNAFDHHFDGIYGARKIAVNDVTEFSGWWAKWKNRRERVNLYPHGCAMLMSRAVFGQGIPTDYITDDHYYLFRYLSHSEVDPLCSLRVVRGAEVYVPMANSAGVALKRFARNYRNLQRVLADVSDENRRCFLRHLHLPGLRFPGSLIEGFSWRFWLRFLFHVGKAAYWYGMRAEILARGLLRRPRKTVWYSAPPTAVRGR